MRTASGRDADLVTVRWLGVDYRWVGVGYRWVGPTLRRMPVEFLTDDEAAAYGRFAGPPAQADLEWVFFLDDEDRALVGRRRGEHMKLGFALQLVTMASAAARSSARSSSAVGCRWPRSRPPRWPRSPERSPTACSP
ncbi:DUF4158 domain-containing protein [Sphaerisporangium corydalis]|uniref:DUF4158 domain-containing protein n=1 Tax=Sphaerisporangium corydalis TaxID=1441875 RepID=A0ABV9EQA8_9ACTN